LAVAGVGGSDGGGGGDAARTEADGGADAGTVRGGGDGGRDAGAPGDGGGDVTDVDGNAYTALTIGAQTWIVGNLKTTKLNDGTPLVFATAGGAWVNLSTNPGYSWPDDKASNEDPYGALYNWAAVKTGKLAPAGWHVATGDEWNTLVMFLGGPATPPYTTAGPALYGSSGFKALGSGFIDSQGANSHFSASGGWWTSTETDAAHALFYYFDAFPVPPYPTSGGNYGYDLKTEGFSVRCVKD
jgi:uncharacterized protein (TIGR02145 family)